MGNGFAILAWDDFGQGLVRINPRLLTDGTKDLHDNDCNWFPYNTDEEKETKIKNVLRFNNITNDHYLIIE